MPNHLRPGAVNRKLGVGKRISDIGSRIGAISLMALVSGCAAIGGTTATSDTYELQSPAVTNARSVRGGVQILITEPAALKALDSQDIVVQTAPLTIQYLESSQWSDRLPRLVQQKLAAAFESSGRFGGVGLPGQGLAIDYQVITEIREFGVTAAGNRADVVISVKLLNDRNGNVAGRQVFQASAVAPSSDPKAYVAALNAAFTDVTEQIVVWVSGRI